MYDLIIQISFGSLMSQIAKRTISLPFEHASYVDSKVSSGDYASVSEVVRAGLRALQERDAAVDHWLREEVATTFDRMKAEPSRAISGTTLFSKLRKRGTESGKA
jgi:antitoxin ParD1/3/4